MIKLKILRKNRRRRKKIKRKKKLSFKHLSQALSLKTSRVGLRPPASNEAIEIPHPRSVQNHPAKNPAAKKLNLIRKKW